MLNEINVVNSPMAMVTGNNGNASMIMPELIQRLLTI